MRDNPFVSIIVRTKDRPKLLKKAIQSIALQTYRPIEVILVNDGGCGFDVEELRGILGDISLNYIGLEKNTGRAHAGNIGIENAKGQYIGFLDDDDEFFPEHVERLVTILEESDYKVAYADTEMICQESDGVGEQIADANRSIFSRDFSYGDLLIENYIPFNSLLFTRDAISSIGKIDETLELYEDWDFLIRAGQKFPFLHIEGVSTKYNQWNKAMQINKCDSDYVKKTHLKIIGKYHNLIIPSFILNLKQEKEKALRDLSDLINKYNLSDATTERLRKEIKERNNEIEEKKAEIMNLKSALADSNACIEQLEKTVKASENRITDSENRITDLEELLSAKTSSLEEVISTAGWKMLEKFRRVREELLPEGSQRRRLCDFALKSFRDGSIKRHHVIDSAQPLENLSKAKIAGRRNIDKNNFKVLFVVNHLDGGQRYRGFNMSEYLKLAGIESDVFFDNEAALWRDRSFEYDVIVLYRLFYTPLIQELILKYKKIGIPVIYDIDDYIFDESALPLLNVRGASKDELAQVIRNHRGVLELCDCCIVPTEMLAKLVKEMGKDAYVIRNGLCQELINISESAYYSGKRDDKGTIKIGYFSGTTTHDNDFLLAAEAILKILEEKEQVALCLGGHLKIDERFEKFQGRVEILPYVYWRFLPFNIAAVDINIVPLKANVFNDAKSELKYFESALLKIPTVASPSESYAFAIRDGINGFLAATGAEWYKCLRLLIEDSALRKKMGEEACMCALSYYSPKPMSGRVLDIYHTIIDKYAAERCGL
jgi:glycosyltransferase involved in cell wall biosynthesis